MLRRAVDSALSQDYPNLEVVISDNASTDGTQAWCEQLARRDSRLRYVRQPTNVGAFALDGVIERPAREPDHLGADADSALVQRFDCDLVAPADLAQHICRRHLAALENQLASAARAHRDGDRVRSTSHVSR